MDNTVKCSHGNCRNDAAWKTKKGERLFCSQHAPLHANAGGFDPVYQEPPAPPPKSTQVKPRDPKWAEWDKEIMARYGKSH